MAHPATLRICGGIGTIGGTCVVVAEAGYQVVLDFGTPLGPVTEYYGGAVRPQRLLPEYLALGIAPRVNEVFRADLLAGSPVVLTPGPEAAGAGAPYRSALFVSHLHLDHCSLIDATASGVPVYMHAESARMLAALRAHGVAYGGPPRAVFPFQYGETIPVGPMRVTPLQVDHDIPGASGFLVETSSGSLVYTGDLRWHGLHPDAMSRFVEAARAARPAALVVEGTRAKTERQGEREADVPDQVARLASGAGALALITLYPRNVERVAGIARAAQEVGRTLALSPPAAWLFARMGGSLRDIALYLPPAYQHQARGIPAAPAQKGAAEGNAQPWLADLLAAAHTAGAPVVDVAAVQGHQDRFLLQMEVEHLSDLLVLQPHRDSVFIHSNGEPLGWYDPGWDPFKNWLDRFNLPLKEARVSGHAPRPDLERIIAGIAPRVVVPVHSFDPDQIPAGDRPVLLPQYGRTYRLDRLVE